MKFKNLNSETFSSLCTGQFFTCGGDLYVKMDELYDKRGFALNCLRIGDGEICYAPPEEPICLFRGTIEIEEGD